MPKKPKDKKEIIMKKRRIPLAQPYYKDKAARTLNGLINSHLFAYKHFETAFRVDAGDVYLARFPAEFGSEIHGDHFVAVILDSNQMNPLLTVVPLKSEKAKEINPASDIRLGVIEGINNGRKTIAIINQTRAIDKRRLLSEEAISALHSLVKKNLLKDYEEVCAEVINCYRLTNEQYNLLRKKAIGYFKNNYISHDDD